MRRSPTAATSLVLALAAALAVVLGPALPAAAAPLGGPGWIVGDSITRQAAPAWTAEHAPHWTVDAKNGRHLYQLPSLVRARVATGQRTGTMVLALGTNDRWPGERTPTLTRTQYVRAVDTIPRTVKVVLVTPYRDPARFGAAQADRMAVVAGWQRDLDRNRPNVTIASWRYRVMTTPDGPARYLTDGVHPTGEGETLWREQLHRAVTVGR